MLLSSLAVSCTNSKSSDKSHAETSGRNLSVDVSSAELGLTGTVSSFKAELDCGTSEIIELNESENSRDLYGDDLSGCNVTLLEYSDGVTTVDTSTPGIEVNPSREINLGSYTPGEDIAINFSVNEIVDGGDEIIENDIEVSEATVTIDVSPAPDYNLTKASIIAIDPLTPGLQIDLDCTTCNQIETALIKSTGQAIDKTELELIFNNTVTAEAGNDLSAAGSLVFKLSNIPVTMAELETSEFIFAMREPGKSSYKYYKLGSHQQDLYTHVYECTTTTELSGSYAIGDSCKVAVTFDANTPNTGQQPDDFGQYDDAVTAVKLFINDVELASLSGNGIGEFAKSNDVPQAGDDFFAFKINDNIPSTITDKELASFSVRLFGPTDTWDDTLPQTSPIDLTKLIVKELVGTFRKEGCTVVTCTADEQAGDLFKADITSMNVYAGEYQP